MGGLKPRFSNGARELSWVAPDRRKSLPGFTREMSQLQFWQRIPFRQQLAVSGNANQDLWQALLAITTKRHVHWHWVKGHAGHPENERADMLARNGVMKQMMQMAVVQTAKNGTV